MSLSMIDSRSSCSCSQKPGVKTLSEDDLEGEEMTGELQTRHLTPAALNSLILMETAGLVHTTFKGHILNLHFTDQLNEGTFNKSNVSYLSTL